VAACAATFFWGGGWILGSNPNVKKGVFKWHLLQDTHKKSRRLPAFFMGVLLIGFLGVVPFYKGDSRNQ
jgi:hypothetical protein